MHSPFRLFKGVHPPIWDDVEQVHRALKDGVIRILDHVGLTVEVRAVSPSGGVGDLAPVGSGGSRAK